jgi:hypothetical protein
MVADDRVHLGVALERDGEPIRGTVCDGDRARLEFSGWLEFMSVLETARAEARTKPSTRDGCRGGDEERAC